MPRTIRAKFRCNSVQQFEHAERVQLTAVYGSSENPANAEWAKHTPAGSLEMEIDNPAAFNAFSPGREYYLDFIPAEAE